MSHGNRRGFFRIASERAWLFSLSKLIFSEFRKFIDFLIAPWSTKSIFSYPEYFQRSYFIGINPRIGPYLSCRHSKLTVPDLWVSSAPELVSEPPGATGAASRGWTPCHKRRRYNFANSDNFVHGRGSSTTVRSENRINILKTYYFLNNCSLKESCI